jgi:DnaJ-class molecular chaperone
MTTTAPTPTWSLDTWSLGCHECHGEGQIECLQDYSPSGRSDDHSTREWTEQCEYCHGEGSYEIPDWVSEEDILSVCHTNFRREDIVDFLDPEGLAELKAEKEAGLR